MFLPMRLTEDAHQHTALPDRQMYTGDHHVHVTSRGNGNLWPQHLCLAPVTYSVLGTKLYVLYTFSSNLHDKICHFIPILHG
uniref:G-patch domain containing 2 like n=1 Tax=Microcebus murinus TaxID=30608 RepID=A0A8C5XGT7_MICMU